MGAPDRTVGLPIHLLYPQISMILLSIPSFASADSVWYVSVSTSTETIRFASQDYCGYQVFNLRVTDKLGCVYRGYQYQIPDGYFGLPIPNNIANNLSKVSVTSVVSFALVLVSGLHHAYTIRYSFRESPEPNKDKMWSLAQIHFVSLVVVFIFTWCAFIAQATIIGNSVGTDPDQGQIGIYWGQSPWLVLASAVIHVGWGYEAVRWRAALLD